MRHLLLILALCAAPLRADTNTQLSNLDGQDLSSPTTLDVYALSSASPTVRSSMIDLASYGGLFVGVTGTANVDVLWGSQADQTRPTSGISIAPGEHKFIMKKARYIGFRISPTSTISYNFGRTPTASVFYTLVAAPGSSSSTPLYAYVTGGAGVLPTGLASITLTGAITWSYQALTCPAAPCNILVGNTSLPGAQTMYWVLDKAITTPVFAGYPLTATAANNPLMMDVVPGDVFHWRYDNAAGNGLLQNRY